MKKWWPWALILVLIVCGLGVIRWQKGTRKPTPVASKAGSVATPVKADAAVRADGKVVPVRSASISPQTSGVVSVVLVRDGQQVKAGQVLLRLEQARQKIAVAQAEAQYLRAKARMDELLAGPRPAEITSAEVSVQSAKARLARVREQGAPVDVALSEAELRAAQAQFDLVKSGARTETITAAKADLASADAALKQAQLNLADTEVKAPFAGTVAAVKANPGEAVGSGTVVMRIFDTSQWQVETSDLTEIAVVKINEGDRASVTFDALKDTQLPGKLLRINPLGENRSGDIVYTAIIALERKDPRLRWGMTASVKIEPNKQSTDK